MNPFGLRVANLLSLRFFLVLLLIGQRRIEIDLGEFIDQIRQHKRVWIVRVKKTAALFGKIGFVRFFVDGEEEFFLEREQFFFAGVRIKQKLSLIDSATLVRIFHHPQQLLVARLTQFHFEHEQTAFGDELSFLLRIRFRFVERFDRFARQPVAKHVLFADQLLDQRFPFVVLMRRDRRRAADDERSARFVDQDGIDFIDNGIIVTALDLLFAGRRHPVVAQIIETEFRVRAVSDVARVLFAAHARLLIVLNAANR